ncbi:MAG: hypothetical protein RI885_1607 [Actinomycetota bacterium]
MSARIPLPVHLATGPFTVAAGRSAGLSAKRMRGSDLARPFRGVRTVGRVDSTADRVEAACECLQPGQFFSHSTAAFVLEVPVPSSPSPSIHVSSILPDTAPVRSGIVGHRLRPLPGGVVLLRGMPVSSPLATWCQLGAELDLGSLVAAGDFVVTSAEPPVTLDELSAAASAWAGRPGAEMLRTAVPHVRVGPLSRPESLSRLLFVAAGLPEPECNGIVRTESGAFLAMGDLVWRKQRQVAEYEGDHHRTDRRQFRRDIRRREQVEDHDWRLTRFTGDDLFARQRELLERIAGRLGIRLHPVALQRALRLGATFRP